MNFLGKTIVIAVVVMLLSSCTLHFKASEVELDADRQRVDNNQVFELEKAELFDG